MQEPTQREPTAMPMDTNDLDQLFSLPANQAWQTLFDLLWQRFAPALRPEIADAHTTDREQSDYLKSNFKSGRATAVEPGDKPHYWVPPLTQIIESQHGRYELVLGRRKWKSQGGYPSLTHGGLSLLEVAVPFIEISR